MVRNSRFNPWSEYEVTYLKINYNDSYSELSSKLGKSIRAIKHKVGNLGLKRNERRKWTQDEFNILKTNLGLTPKDFVERKLLDRSEVQVAIQLRKIRGTALRGFKIEQTCDDAYLLGAICSDCLVDKRGIELSQKISDEPFVLEVKRILELHDLKVSVRKYVKSSQTGASNEYWYLFAGGKSILNHLATKGGLEVNNVRGPESEWVDFIDLKFNWVWNDEFFWYFIGGLFDGDGSGSKGKPSIAIKPSRSARKVADELMKREFDIRISDDSIYVKGGQEEYTRFFSSVKHILSRKSSSLFFEVNSKSVQNSIVLEDGVRAVSQSVVKPVFEREHYLGTIPGGASCYAVITGGVVVAAAAFKKTENKQGTKQLELRRFVTTKHSPGFASKSLAAILKVVKLDFEDCLYVVSFADRSQGHQGIIYKALGGILVGDTGPSVKICTGSGREFGGRFLAQTLLAANVDLNDCTVKIVEGKNKYLLRLNASVGEFSDQFKAKAI